MHGSEVRIQEKNKKNKDGTKDECKIRGLKDAERNMRVNEAEKLNKDVKEIGGQGKEEVQALGFYRTHSSRNLIKFYN